MLQMSDCQIDFVGFDGCQRRIDSNAILHIVQHGCPAITMLAQRLLVFAIGVPLTIAVLKSLYYQAFYSTLLNLMAVTRSASYFQASYQNRLTLSPAINCRNTAPYLFSLASTVV